MTVIDSQLTDNLLHDLLIETRITHIDIAMCAMQHMSRINHMIDIFDHKTDKDRQLVLELIGLIAQEQRDDAIKFYKKTYKFSENPASDRDDEVLLITACLHNPPFFSFAQSVCEDIKAEVRKSSANVIYHYFQKSEIPESIAAAEPGFYTFHELKVNLGDIHGTLHFKKDDLDNLQLELIFDESQEFIPSELQVHFTTKRDGEPHEIDISKLSIKDDEHRIISISSELISGIDHMGGIICDKIQGSEFKKKG
jgi:hypothetical protein